MEIINLKMGLFRIEVLVIKRVGETLGMLYKPQIIAFEYYEKT